MRAARELSRACPLSLARARARSCAHTRPPPPRAGSTNETRLELQEPDWLGPDAQEPRLFFAGEACAVIGAQCVHGAVETGELAARQMLRTHQYHVSKASGETPKLCVCNGGARVWDAAPFSQPMIECGACHRWFHGPCLGVDITRVSEADEWTCPGCCKEAGGRPAMVD